MAGIRPSARSHEQRARFGLDVYKRQALRRATQRLGRCGNLDGLLETALDSLECEFGIGQIMLLMHDEGRGRLYTLASRGYAESGIGSEIPIGAGAVSYTHLDVYKRQQ